MFAGTYTSPRMSVQVPGCQCNTLMASTTPARHRRQFATRQDLNTLSAITLLKHVALMPLGIVPSWAPPTDPRWPSIPSTILVQSLHYLPNTARSSMQALPNSQRAVALSSCAVSNVLVR
ncbi:hypothetical protein PMIN03_006077 [Paraphaeosphaeria minitans]